MLNRTHILGFVSMSLLLLSACATNHVKPSAQEKQGNAQLTPLPSWLVNPVVTGGGIAAADCVLASDDFGIDKSQVVTKCRNDLAEQIIVRAKAAQHNYLRKVKAIQSTGQPDTGAAFNSVARDVSEASLSGSHVMKLQYFMINGKKNLCAMVGIDPDMAKGIFNKIVKKSGDNVTPESKADMFEEFKAHQAQANLTNE